MQLLDGKRVSSGMYRMVGLALAFVCFSFVLPAQEGGSLQERASRLLEKYPEADTNGDGVLTREEFDRFREKRVSTSNARSGKTELAKRFEDREFEEVRYRFFAPQLEGGERRYPIILSLHGAGGKGSDNLANLTSWTAELIAAELQERHPAFVVVPQSPGAWRVANDRSTPTAEEIATYPEIWQTLAKSRLGFLREAPEGNLDRVFRLLDSLADSYPIDTDRVYILGHSMGGFGTFEAIAREPDRFAAAIPSAGGLNPWHDPKLFQEVPIWAFHGEDDATVPYALSALVFEEMKRIGGDMKLTRLGGVGHGAAAFAFGYEGDGMGDDFETVVSKDGLDSTENVWDWLFSKTREGKD